MSKIITKHRRGTTEEWNSSKIIPSESELVIEECSDGLLKFKIGDGHRLFSELPYPDEKTQQAINLANARIDNFISVTGEVDELDPLYELIDIRVGYDGVTYDSAGEAVRAIGQDTHDLRNSLQQFINADAVDGLIYENNLLQLTASGIPVGEPVEVVGGSGGGGSSTNIRVINNNGTASISASIGSPVELKFTFTSIEDDIPTGDGVCTITVNGIQRNAFSIPQGNNVVDVSSYLNAGSNNVRVTCTDQYGNSRSLAYTVTIIELRITSSFNCVSPFEKDIHFKYVPYGLVEKDIHFVVDGREVAVFEGLTASGKQTTQIIPVQVHGSHTLDVYMTAMLNENLIESNHLTYEFMCVEEGWTDAMMSSVFTTTSVVQGDLISIPYVIYDPSSLSALVELKVTYMKEGKEVEYSKQELLVDRTQHYWSTRQYPEGNVKFTITYNYNWSAQLNQYLKTLSRSYSVKVAEPKIDVEAETNDLELYLSAAGRSNNEATPGIWSYKDVTTSFNNFNWKSNGWVTDSAGDVCLRINGDAHAVINFQPFEDDFRPEGKTIEFEFAVHDVNKRDEVVIDCYNGGIGFQATADTAFLNSQDTRVQCNYKENERVRVAFAVEKLSDGNRFMSIYLDGVLSGITQYGENDNFEQPDPALNITLGSPYCALDLYTIRVYNTTLTSNQLIDNYIADMGDPVKKMNIFTANDIFDDYTGELSYIKLKQKIPTVTFIGKMPTYKGDKKQRSVRMIFEHPDHPELDFDEILKQIDVQGTSSAGYVRKNWKTKHDEEKVHMVGELPAKVFCLKVDYAEGTGTHNTQNANLIETFYTEPIPPMIEEDFPSNISDSEKEDLRKVRTTIAGYPIVIFHLDTDDMNIIQNITKDELALRTDLKFSSKGNFNYDKDAEDVFAFNDNYDTECWEFLQNSDQNSFLTPWPEDYTKYWEARYHPKLSELEDLQDDGNISAASKLQDEMIQRFKVMYEWVHSTARGTYVDAEGVEHPLTTNEPLETPYTDKYGTVHEVDNDAYRLAKFKTEFEDYFNLHYTTIYYVYTFFALMVDQRAKNLFLTYWHDNAYDNTTPGRWYPYFYDNDTSYGINNTGHLTFDYYHEDTDTIGTAKVFNGQQSVLWCNFRDAFPEKIKEEYAYLRNNNKLTYDSIVNTFIDNGSSKWSASVYNKDANHKYISIATPESDWDSDGDGKYDQTGAYLYEVRGNGEHHLKYIVHNRIKYCDSKWICGNYVTDLATVRIYTPTSKEITEEMSPEEKAEIEALNTTLQVVPPSANITLTPYSNMYCGVAYGAASGDDPTIYIQQVRATKNVPVTFQAGTSNVNDKETYIYGASEISSFGDLSPLYCKLLDVGAATKLIDLDIGNQTPGYINTNLETVTVGSNTLLKRIDVSNCPNLKNTLDVSKCTNIEEIYAMGSGISSVALPESGYVRILKLPDTITNVTIKNQLYIEELTFERYNGIKTLCIDNCPTIDTVELLENCKDATGKYTVERVRLTGINWPNASLEFLRSLYSLKGQDELGANTDDAYLIGTAHISKLTGEEMAEINSHYPHLKITYDELTAHITFMDSTGTIELDKQTIISRDSIGASAEDPVQAGRLSEPTKESTAQYHFTWNGWTTHNGSAAELDALHEVTADRVVYPAFKNELRYYAVRFFNETQLLDTRYTGYGLDAIYPGEDPEKLNTSSPELYEFRGWYPSPENITGPLDTYAQFFIEESNYTKLQPNDVDVQLNDETDELTILKYNGNDTIISIPEKFDTPLNKYTTVALSNKKNTEGIIVSGAFEGADIELVSIPDSIKIFDDRVFNYCSKLTSIEIPVGTELISNQSFANLTSLKTVNYDAANAKVTRSSTTNSPFENSMTSEGFVLTIGDQVVQIPNYLFYQHNNRVNNSTQEVTKRAVRKIEWAEPCKCHTINNGAFYNAGLVELELPDSLRVIRNQSFAINHTITDLVIPQNVETIGDKAFSQWTKLKSVTLPASLVSIGKGLFAGCGALNSIEIDPNNPVYQVVDKSLVDIQTHKLIQSCAGGSIPQNGTVSIIGDSAFDGATYLHEVVVPEGVVTIEQYAFTGCSFLSHLDLPNSLTYIGSQAFYQCKLLCNDSGKLILPDAITDIWSSAFSGCESIKEVTLPAALSYIGQYAFSGCISLETITFKTVPNFGQSGNTDNVNIFTNCPNLKIINFPGTESELPSRSSLGITNDVVINYNYKGE